MASRHMTVIEHLEELRQRLFVCLAAVAVGAVAAYAAAGRVVEWLARPVGRLVFLHPFEAFTAYLHIACIGGLVLALPVVLYEVWGYVSPALTARERRWLACGMAASAGLFLAGMAVAYFVVIPLGLRFLLGFASATVQPMLSVGSYISTVGWLLLAFGLAFQLPLVLLLLTLFGVVDARRLARWRPHAIVALLVIAAALTPGPDVLSQLALAIPMWILFELSLWLARRACLPRENSAGRQVKRA